MSDTLANRAEAILFSEGGSLTVRKLAGLLKVQEGELAPVLRELGKNLQGSGITLIQTGTEVSLAVAPDIAPALREAYRSDLEKDIGDAGLEVLAIVLYGGPSTRARIDYIRGVNTGSTVRNLLARGLLERIGNPEDAREYLYRPTVELLAHLGVQSLEELPERTTIAAELAAFESQAKAQNNPYGAA